MADPVIILRSSAKWEACPFCSSAPIPTPAFDATFEEKIQHYVGVHNYDVMKTTEETEAGADGKPTKVKVAELERPQLAHGPLTLYKRNPDEEPLAECHSVWCVLDSHGEFSLREIHAWWVHETERTHAKVRVLALPCKTRSEVIAEFDARVNRLEAEGWTFKLIPSFDSIRGLPIAVRVP